MTDPAQPLKDFQPKKKFFVGIDSDGCAFDTMGIKHRECFCPWLIGYFGLQPVAQAACVQNARPLHPAHLNPPLTPCWRLARGWLAAPDRTVPVCRSAASNRF